MKHRSRVRLTTFVCSNERDEKRTTPSKLSLSPHKVVPVGNTAVCAFWDEKAYTVVDMTIPSVTANELEQFCTTLQEWTSSRQSAPDFDMR